MTQEEIAKVEDAVNRMILLDMPVTVEELPIEEAKNKGAMALFGEKYGNIVRVVSMGEASVEFCGGTHVAKTGQLGVFKIVGESSVAAGVRRIEAATGMGVLDLLHQSEKMLDTAAAELKLGSRSEVPAKVASVVKELKEKDKEIEALNAKIAGSQVESLMNNSQDVEGLQVVYTAVSGATPEGLRLLGDKLKEKSAKIVAVLWAGDSAKMSVLAVCGGEAVKAGAHAGNLIKEIASQLGGKGGGRPDSAMGGITETAKLEEVMATLPQMLEKQLENKKK